jgi:hypothetical protein
MNKRNHLKFYNPATELLAITLISLSLLGPVHAEDTPVSPPDGSAGDGISVSVENANDLSAMLPFLLTSSERKRLAGELLDAIERGDLKGAEDDLNAAIEAGTLAIALIDRLHDPDLLSTLKGLGLQGSPQSPPASSNACSEPAMPAANLARLQEAVDQEHAHNVMASETLAGLMEQNNALTARLETEASNSALKTSELEKALQEEQRLRETVSRELVSLQSDYRTLQANEKSSAVTTALNTQTMEALLQQERERSGNAEQQLTQVREELNNLRASKDRELQDKEAMAASQTTELRQALLQAQERGAELAQKLTSVTEALRSLQEAREQNPSPMMLGPAPTGGKAFTTSMGVPPAPIAPALPAEAGVVLEESRPASRSPLERTALVAVAQLSEDVHPLSANVASAPVPARPDIAPNPQPEATSPPQEVKPDDRLTIRADELFKKGDVSGARLLLEHSVKSGNARAAFLLAETYDPHVLAKLGVMGIRGDAGRARELYAQAQAMGMPQASERMQALK